MNGTADIHRASRLFYLFAGMCRFKTPSVVFFVLLASLSLFAAEPAEAIKLDSAVFGKPVHRIDFTSDLPIDRSHYDPYIGIEPGDVLTRTEVKGAIQFLFECGRFSAISVEANPVGNSVDLLFNLRQNYYFNKFMIDGDVDLKGRSLWEWISLPIGQRFTEGRLEKSRQTVLKFMHERGFYRAQVKARTEADEENRQVDTIFEVQPGDLATVSSIEIAGVPSSDAAEMLQKFGFQKGGKYDRSRLSSRLDVLRRQFLKKGFLAAVAQVSETLEPESNTVALTLTITNFGKMKVVVDGFKIDKDQLRRLLPILTGEGIDREILEEGLKNLRGHLENNGYSAADVQISETDDNSGVRVFHYQIAPGHKFTVS